MKTKNQHINHLTPQQIEDYTANRLTNEQMHAIEKHMLNCEFCEAAVEGLSENGLPFGFNDDVEILKTRVDNRAAETRKRIIPYWQLGVAASILIIIGVGSFFMFGNKTETPQVKLADKKEALKKEEPSVLTPDTATQKADTAIIETVTKEPEVEPHSFLVAENKAFTDAVYSGSSSQVQANFTAPSATPISESFVDSDVMILANVEEMELALVQDDESTEPEVLSEKDEKEFKKKDNTKLYSIKGTIVNQVGEPIPFANVIDLTDNSGAVSDLNGTFELKSKVDSPNIKVNFVGYKTVEVLAWADKPVNITLSEDAVALSEVVVTSSKIAENNVSLNRIQSLDVLSTSSNEVSKTVTPAPTPTEGYQKFNSYMKTNAKLTDDAKANNVSGTVKVSFKIDNNGRPKSFKVLNSLGFGCDDLVINLIENGPTWTTDSNERVEYEVELR